MDEVLAGRLMRAVYDVAADAAAFKCGYSGASSFDRLRNGYPPRRECLALPLVNVPEELAPALAALGFNPSGSAQL